MNLQRADEIPAGGLWLHATVDTLDRTLTGGAAFLGWVDGGARVAWAADDLPEVVEQPLGLVLDDPLGLGLVGLERRVMQRLGLSWEPIDYSRLRFMTNHVDPWTLARPQVWAASYLALSDHCCERLLGTVDTYPVSWWRCPENGWIMEARVGPGGRITSEAVDYIAPELRDIADPIEALRVLDAALDAQ